MLRMMMKEKKDNQSSNDHVDNVHDDLDDPVEHVIEEHVDDDKHARAYTCKSQRHV
jgi:hypothetical protein